MTALNNHCASIPEGIDITTELNDIEKNEAFRKKKLDLPKDTFGLALVLGGTVSAGAFTAGVLDFLIEALDEWDRVRNSDPNAAQHKVSLTIVTGSSGGGVCGAILSRYLGIRFPHVKLNPNSPPGSNQPLLFPTTGGSVSNNPFWKVWIENLRIKGLLGLENSEESLLSAVPLEKSALDIAYYSGAYEANRQWIHDDFNLVLALTNLRGIPTKIEYNNLNQSFLEHADQIRFGIAPTAGKQRDRKRKVHESKILGPISSANEWEEFTQFVLGTGAFPVGFPARELNRCITDYRCRPVVIPDSNETDGCRVEQLPIDTEALNESGVQNRSEYNFLSVDAGVTNNAPVEIARTHLSGFGTRNKRNPYKADRAVVLIDPFAERVKVDPPGPKSKFIFQTLFKMIYGAIEESRYHTRDVMLAADPEIKSRLLVTAFRPDPRSTPTIPLPDLVGGEAICSSRLGAFFGFFNEEYSKHDFFLGRYCCQYYLLNQNETWLPNTNSIFGIAEEKKNGDKLPLIPLYGSAADPQKIPEWPSWAKFSPDSLKDSIHRRLEAVIDAQIAVLEDGMNLGGVKKMFIDGFIGTIKFFELDKAVDAIVSQIEDAKNAKNDKSIPPL